MAPGAASRRALLVAPMTFSALSLLALSACAAPAPACGGASRAPLTAVDRYLLGDAVPLTRRPTLRAQEDELSRSMAARRQLGWALATELLSPVELTGAGGARYEAPRFATWLDAEDLRRVHRALPPGAPTDEALDAAFDANREAVLSMDGWPEDRLARYVEGVDSAERAHGVGGVSRVLYGPRAARHLLRSEAALTACRGRAFEPLESGPARAEARTVREAVAACEARTLGPFFVAEGGALHASVEGPLELTAGAEADCDEAGCVVAGPARVELSVRGVAEAPGEVVVRYDDAEAFWVPCLDGAMPDGAAIVKADYRRADFGFEVDVHDTTAGSLGALRAGAADWADAAVGSADPGPDAIHTVVLDDGARYRLVGLHAMVKELDHWVWVTLFWTPEARAGLGADGPAALDGPLAHYGMCVVTDFVERDPDPSAGLAPAVSAVVEATRDEATWCSNPYIEQGAGNAATNCVGCHQHAGSGLLSESILAEPPRFGRRLVRTGFPSDYVFSTSALIDIFLEP